MDNLEFITFSKVYNYKNVDGKFCYINLNNDYFYVNLPTSKVIFDVDYSYNKPTLVISLTDKNLIEFIDNFKKIVIDFVYHNCKQIFGVQKSLSALEEFYCSPVKKSLKHFADTLKLKLLNKKINPLMRNTKIDITLHISGLWFNSDSFGPYFDVMDLTLIELPFTPKKNIYSFIEEEILI